MGRAWSIEEIGGIAVFLVSEESKYITGTEIIIDSGNIIIGREGLKARVFIYYFDSMKFIMQNR